MALIESLNFSLKLHKAWHFTQAISFVTGIRTVVPILEGKRVWLGMFKLLA